MKRIIKANQITAADNAVSPDDVRELALFIENEPDLYYNNIKPAIANLHRKYKAGKYDRELATKLWQYVADEGVRQYGKKFGSGASVAWLNPATRKAIAEELRDFFEDEVMEEVEASTKVTAASSYGWEVDPSEAWEAYEFACEVLGKEYVDNDIVTGLSTDELAESLAYMFRMNEFDEWYEHKGYTDDEDEDEEE